jgi:ribosomal protein L11 methyltransferase
MKRKPVWQLSVTTTLEAEDAVGALLTDITGVTATSFTDAESGLTTVSVCGPQSFDQLPNWRGKLQQGLQRIRVCRLDLGDGRIHHRRLRAEDWAESWKRHFQPFTIGRQLLVKPSWSRRQPNRGQAVMVIDPGLSFGTGQHPTTRFCLRELARHRRCDLAQAMLDVGTGSGILAIAAAKLGYGPIRAFDFDPECVRVARVNAKINTVSKTVDVQRSDITLLSSRGVEKFPVICANLLANLLVAERRKLVARLAKGGVLIVAGILHREFAAVRSAFEQGGLEYVRSRVEKEWESGTFRLAR